MKRLNPAILIHDGTCEISIPTGPYSTTGMAFYVTNIREIGIAIQENASIEPLLPTISTVPIGGNLQLSLVHTKFPGTLFPAFRFLQTEWFDWMDIRVKAEGAVAWQHSTRLFGVRREGCDIVQEGISEGAWILTGGLSYTFERYSDPATDGLNVLTNKSKRWYF